MATMLCYHDMLSFCHNPDLASADPFCVVCSTRSKLHDRNESELHWQTACAVNSYIL